MFDVFVIGAGGLGREASWVVQETSGMFFGGYLVDEPDKNNQFVVGTIEENKNFIHNSYVVCAVGLPKMKKYLVSRAEEIGWEFITVKHPSVQHSNSVYFGEGSIVGAGSILTVNIEIGKHVGVLGCTVGHDSVVGDYSTLCPNVCISGHCKIGEGVFIGANATLLPGISIGDGAVVGAGAVVTKDVASYTTVAGVPAKLLEKNNAS